MSKIENLENKVKYLENALNCLKRTALTNPVTGTGTTNYVSKFTGTSTIGNSLVFDNGTNVGIGKTNPTYLLDVNGDALINTVRVGLGAGAISDNVVVGQGALAANTTGSELVAVGSGSMAANTEGIYNTAVGTNALGTNTTGRYLTALGASAGYKNTTGWGNIFIGKNSGFSDNNITGGYNVLVGADTGKKLSSGQQGLYMGYQAGYNNSTGDGNFALGYQSLYTNSTGRSNSALGYSALYTTTGSSNIALGSFAGYYETGSNKLYITSLGNATTEADGKTKAIIYGEQNTTPASQILVFNANVGIGTTSPSSPWGKTLHLYDVSNAAYTLQTSNKTFYIMSDTNGYLGFVDYDGGNYTRRMVIDTNGNVGIGITNPSEKLDIVGDNIKLRMASSTNPTYKFSIQNNYDANNTINFFGPNDNNLLKYIFNTNSLSLMPSSGYVGVGTTSPKAKLHSFLAGSGSSDGPTGTVLIGQNSTEGSNAYLTLVGAYNSEAGIVFTDESTAYKGKIGYNNNTEHMYFNIDGSEKMRINSAGNVGIGITSPTAVLHLKAGTAADNTAPLKLTVGTALTVAEAGVINHVGTTTNSKMTITPYVNSVAQVNTIVGAITKTDTGDPANAYEGQMCINTFDNTLKVYAESAWRQIATW